MGILNAHPCRRLAVKQELEKTLAQDDRLPKYAGPDGEEPATRILCPYGILYGGRGWLVGHVDELPEMRLWRLDRIVSIDLLDRGFTRREDFDLSAYAAQSFGVFQEEPIDVVLRFEPEAAGIEVAPEAKSAA